MALHDIERDIQELLLVDSYITMR